jgi:diguanylate cyclase (GGDEF)-like protein/PAS domain S-box-containing protein
MPDYPFLPASRARRNAIEWAWLVLVVALCATMAGYAVWRERALTLAANAERMRMLTLNIDAQLQRQMGGVRNALLSARAAFLPEGGCPLQCRQILLHSLKMAMPGVTALAVVDRQGRTGMSVDESGFVSLENRAYLAGVESMHAPETLYLSQPQQKSPAPSNIELSMAMLDSDGHNAGAVSAILSPAYLANILRAALYAPDMNGAITDENGSRILEVGAEPAPDLLFARHGQSGESLTVMTGGERLVVQRTMLLRGAGLDKSLVIGMSRDVGRMALAWNGMAWACGCALGLSGLAGALGLIWLQRRRAELESLAQARAETLATTALRVDMALAGANLGLWDWHLPSDSRTVDARAGAMLGYAHDEPKGAAREWRTLMHPDDRPAHDAALAGHRGDSSRCLEMEYRMRHRSGEWIWLLDRGNVVERTETGAPLRMLGTCMDISVRKLAEAELAHLAFYDGLTKLPNRRLLRDRLEHAIAKCERGACHGAVLFVDLDNFKSMNDTMGHEVGDRFLEMVAFRLQQVMREIDTVARLGGDEFVILLEDLGAQFAEAVGHAELVAQKVLNALNLCYTLGGRELHSTPSIGVVMFGSGGHTVDDLLRQADLAMYEAKAGGRNTFRFFDPCMQQARSDTAAMEAELRCLMASSKWHTAGGDRNAAPRTTRPTSARAGL